MRNRRGDRKRALLVEAARTVVARVGPRKATLEDVAAEARVGRSTVFYHFASKGELLRVLIEAEVEALMDSLRSALDPALRPPERLAAYARARAAQIRRLLGLYQVSADIAGEYMRMAEAEVEQLNDGERALLASILREGATQGAFLLRDPDLLASVMQVALRGLAESFILRGGSAFEQESECLVATLLRGILAEPGEDAPC